MSGAERPGGRTRREVGRKKKRPAPSRAGGEKSDMNSDGSSAKNRVSAVLTHGEDVNCAISQKEKASTRSAKGGNNSRSARSGESLDADGAVSPSKWRAWSARKKRERCKIGAKKERFGSLEKTRAFMSG